VWWSSWGVLCLVSRYYNTIAVFWSDQAEVVDVEWAGVVVEMRERGGVLLNHLRKRAERLLSTIMGVGYSRLIREDGLTHPERT
jgi:hypothetical protein